MIRSLLPVGTVHLQFAHQRISGRPRRSHAGKPAGFSRTNFQFNMMLQGDPGQVHVIDYIATWNDGKTEVTRRGALRVVTRQMTFGELMRNKWPWTAAMLLFLCAAGLGRVEFLAASVAGRFDCATERHPGFTAAAARAIAHPHAACFRRADWQQRRNQSRRHCRPSIARIAFASKYPQAWKMDHRGSSTRGPCPCATGPQVGRDRPKVHPRSSLRNGRRDHTNQRALQLDPGIEGAPCFTVHCSLALVEPE